MMNEPRLDARDVAVWERLLIRARLRSREREHRRLVDAARLVAERVLARAERPAVYWSGGKDSTAMAALLLSLVPSVQLVSEKDDLDYPGEEAYVTGLAARWGARLEILRPEVSPSAWIAGHAGEMAADDDFHSRRTALSKACFYGLVERDNARRDAIFLGLRAEESAARQRGRAAHGLDYVRADGLRVCSPIGDWTGLDVFAYLLELEVEPFAVYRCCGYMHEREPWRVRKSWWLPGDRGKHGGTSWLRRYWPSLYRRLVEWFPLAQGLA
jgi:3'-phosphoadenosine 5'-phosphosulfate sulfotransferase (PAPS reductase)/FAD synthetase